MNRTEKEQRLNIRVSGEFLDALREAATSKGMTLTAYVVQTLTADMNKTSSNQINEELNLMNKRLELLEQIVLANHKIGNAA